MRFAQPTPEQEDLWRRWTADRPPVIREVIERCKLDPWTLYRLKTTGQRVFVVGLSEPELTTNQEVKKVTCRVGVSGEFNLVTFERQVFGVDPDDLEECDLPRPDDQVGTLDLPVDVVRNLRDKYPDACPPHVMLDLITRYPLKTYRAGEKRP